MSPPFRLAGEDRPSFRLGERVRLEVRPEESGLETRIWLEHMNVLYAEPLKDWSPIGDVSFFLPSA
jgi:hypothetical protein